MRSVGWAALPLLAAVSLHAADAGAVAPPAASAGRPKLEVFGGVEAGRLVEGDPSPSLSGRAPRAARAAWARFAALNSGGWRAQWDLARAVPSRIWGPGIAAPGSVASPQEAERWAVEVLSRHLDLLAPGAEPGDFEVVANDLDGALRTVGMAQRHHGLPVLRGQVSFRFKGDRLIAIGSEARPHLGARVPTSVISEATARAAAEDWLLRSSPVAGSIQVTSVEGPMVLALSGGRLGDRVVQRVVADARAPLGRWSVYVDAATGAPVAREQTLRFADGGVTLLVPDRYPGGGRLPYPAKGLELTVDGAFVIADAAGAFSWPGAALASVVVSSLTGPLVTVNSAAGPEATLAVGVDPGSSYLWDASSEEFVDSQLTTFTHAHEVKAYAKGISPEMAWLDTQLVATVNIDDECNAYSDGVTINFFRAAGGCDNTGLLADVVYHEFGHAYHLHSILPGTGEFEGALSEGVSDYLAATITGDSAMGRGFTFNSNPLREIDPIGYEHAWPDDVVDEVHYDGLIIAGALWDLRKLLVDKLGEAEGVSHTDYLYQQGMRRAVDIPSMYPEILTADDDDGDLENGSPNRCEIDAAFGLHGLRATSIAMETPGVVAADLAEYPIALQIGGLSPSCPGDSILSASLKWRNEDKPSSAGTIGLAPELSSGVTTLSAKIPQQEPGSVVRYHIDVMLDSGTLLRFPDNPADPEYQLFVGEVIELYCTDFEVNPEQDGWTHQLDQGEPSEGADDWQFGPPNGTAKNGDPTEAYSGNRVFGNDLSLQEQYNGLYQAEKVNSATTPPIDTKGYAEVRLQYRRWLNVEDAQFDRASIYANEELVWQNLDSQQGEASVTHHRDREWRFHDVDLSDHVDDDGTVQVKFEIASDGGFELGGWTIDDFCVVAFEHPDPGPCNGPDCGDGGAGGTGLGGEPANDQPAEASSDDDGCGCRAVGEPSGARGALALALALGAAVLRRRRRLTP